MSAPADEFALYRLDQSGSTLGSLCSRPFDSAEYSRYKYGSASAADGYARMLCSAFLPRHRRLAHMGRLLVAASPYRYVPTAANEVAVRFAAMLTAQRAEHGLPPARVVRIDRMAVPEGDTLNHAAVRTLGDLAGIAAGPDFTWNVRVCKFVLNPVNRAGLASFLTRMPEEFVRNLCRNSVADGYARMGPYRDSYQIAAGELSRRAARVAAP